MHVGFAAVLLLLVATGCVRPKPDTAATDPQTTAKQPAVTQTAAEPATQPPGTKPTPATPQPAVEPAPAQPVATPTPAAPPEPVAKPTAPSPQEPVATPAAPTPPPAAKPAASEPSQPVAKSTPAPPPKPGGTPTAPPSPPKPAAPPATGATTPAQPAAGKVDSPAPIKPAAPTLDLNALKEEVKSTSAIGFFTKITLKNQVDDLLDAFRDYHQAKSKLTKAELRRSYDLLLMKVLSLLQDKDPRLASSIVSSREAIWDLLADPKKFATLPG